MRPNASLSDLVRASELRETFGVSQTVVRGWCAKGLPWIQVGRERCFFVDELLDFANTELRRTRAGAQPSPSPTETPPSSTQDAL